jgi:hypothetical protein
MDVSTWANLSKAASILVAAMPMPSSLTRISACPLHQAMASDRLPLASACGVALCSMSKITG